jgi:hypothetical protein
MGVAQLRSLLVFVMAALAIMWMTFLSLNIC